MPDVGKIDAGFIIEGVAQPEKAMLVRRGVKQSPAIADEGFAAADFQFRVKTKRETRVFLRFFGRRQGYLPHLYCRF